MWWVCWGDTWSMRKLTCMQITSFTLSETLIKLQVRTILCFIQDQCLLTAHCFYKLHPLLSSKTRTRKTLYSTSWKNLKPYLHSPRVTNQIADQIQRAQIRDFWDFLGRRACLLTGPAKSAEHPKKPWKREQMNHPKQCIQLMIISNSIMLYLLF